MVWLSCIGVIVLCVFLLLQSGLNLGTLIIPPGTSIVNLLSIPLFQSILDQILPLIAGIGGSSGGFNIMALLTPLIIWFLTPVIIVIVAAILGAVVRKKEEF